MTKKPNKTKKPSPIKRIAIALESIAKNIESGKSIGSKGDHKIENPKDDYFQITDWGKIKTSEMVAEMKKKFPVWCYYDDAKLDADFPAPKEPTTRYFLKNIEPDPETLGLSVRQVEEKGLQGGITLRERLLMELEYFAETGKHLDVKGITFCSGSRCSVGNVPHVCLCGSGVRVRWCGLDGSASESGVRRAVTL